MNIYILSINNLYSSLFCNEVRTMFLIIMHLRCLNAEVWLGWITGKLVLKTWTTDISKSTGRPIVWLFTLHMTIFAILKMGELPTKVYNT